MPFGKLLSSIMNDRNLTASMLSQKCKEYGEPIDETYLSKIINSKKNPPSEEKLKVIAKVCNIDERYLIIESYIDKAPQVIRDFFCMLNSMSTIAATKTIENMKYYDKKVLREELKKFPVSDTIIDFLDNYKNYEKYIDNEFDMEVIQKDKQKITLCYGLKEPEAIKIHDDAMAPIIKKGDKIIIKSLSRYKSNDILLIKIKGEKEAKVRYLYRINGTVRLTAINNKYPEICCLKDEVTILGKVTQIISKL